MYQKAKKQIKNQEFKTIFSLKVKVALSHAGFEPIVEKDNKNKEGFKCWVYERTPAFIAALNEILGGR